jgi:hypothetical protein
MLPSGNLDRKARPGAQALAALVELERVESRRLDVVIVASAALGKQVWGQASCHDDPWEAVHREARIHWWELILTILA